MNLASLNEYEVRILATANETDLGRLLERLAKEEAEEILEQTERNLRVNTERVQDDLRFQFGMRKGIRRFLAWQQEAVKWLKEHERSQSK